MSLSGSDQSESGMPERAVPSSGELEGGRAKRLLVLELWGVGDLALATPFLQAASQRYQVTLLAKPWARDFQPRFWPAVQVIPCVAPWTAFRGKYRLHRWPWKDLGGTLRLLRHAAFDLAVSARWDPRDHVLMAATGARHRVGFPRLGSGLFLSAALAWSSAGAHRFDDWRRLAQTLGVEVPTRGSLVFPASPSARSVLVHSGASQLTKVWPLARFSEVVFRLKKQGFAVEVACDAGQLDWWRSHGIPEVKCPGSVAELIDLVSRARAFVGNDSGPGHLAAISGVPTFTLFGNQFPERFAPLHPRAEWIEGEACPYKPCFDSCRFPVPNCLWDLPVEKVWQRIEAFVRKLEVS